ncbi:hypothetical protein ACTPOK_38830 [Streptomyces inhibens]|uniref:hypothetical protein n=1 Tax=Streptomyces inhibens TaxID=2293571 RepID=UPI00402AB998
MALLSYNAIEVGLPAVFGWFADSGFRDLTGVRVPWWAWAPAGLVAIGFLGRRASISPCRHPCRSSSPPDRPWRCASGAGIHGRTSS